MAIGEARIFKTTTNGPYAYTWKDDVAQDDLDAVVTGKTLVQAYNEVGALAAAMTGQIQNVVVRVVSAALFMFLLLPSLSQAGSQDIRPYVLFGGSNTDSTEQASAWIPVFGADRVIIRTYSTHEAFAASGADSLFGDSLTTFKLLFSDSVGTFVTGPSGRSTPVCADSFVVDPSLGANTDSTKVGIAARTLPINKELRAPSNGSGLITSIFPIGLQANSSLTVVSINTIGKQYMRVRVTPLRRMTANTSTCTGSPCGNRINGLKGFKMIAYVVHINK